jgi:hypothetical protein
VPLVLKTVHLVPGMDPGCTEVVKPWMKNFVQKLYYCADDEPPSRRSSSKSNAEQNLSASFRQTDYLEIAVKELCSIEYGIQYSEIFEEPEMKGPTNDKYRGILIELQILPGSAAIDFIALHKDIKW